MNIKISLNSCDQNRIYSTTHNLCDKSIKPTPYQINVIIDNAQLLHRSDVTSVCCCCALLMFVNKKLHCHKIADKDNTHTVCRGTLTDRG